MSELSELVARSVDRLLADIAETGAPPDEAWHAIEALGIPSLFLPEQAGGMVGGWSDAEPVFRLCGRHALALPVGETMIARKLAAAAGNEFPDGPVSWTGNSGAGAPFALGAMLRTAQIAGALEGCLAMCVRYAAERSQFGRELRKFQAIQHQIAVLAEEAAAVASASAAAAAALDRRACPDDALFEIACAKLRANQACGTGALIAHQVHGAIGITGEFALHRLTGQLWTWRSEFGNDRHWAQWLGRRVLAQGAPPPWEILTSRSLK